MVFKTKIGYYVSSTDGYTNDEAKQYIVDGCYDVYRKIKATKGEGEALKFAMGTDSAITNGNAIDIDEVHEVLYVQRNNISATQVKAELAHKYTDVDSIYYASAEDPIYYFKEQYMHVKPAATGSAELYYMYLPAYSVTNYDTEPSSIDKFPAEYYDHVLIYASFKILEAKLHDYIEDDEDGELAQLMAGRVDRLKLQYNEMFGAAQ